MTRERTHWATCWDLPGHEGCAVARMVRVQELANKQALDDGLWFRAEHVTEDYLQCALRRLHRVIEGEE